MAFTGHESAVLSGSGLSLEQSSVRRPDDRHPPFSETAGRVRGGVKKGLGIASVSKCKKKPGALVCPALSTMSEWAHR
jgi:hypothetical protein